MTSFNDTFLHGGRFIVRPGESIAGVQKRGEGYRFVVYDLVDGRREFQSVSKQYLTASEAFSSLYRWLCDQHGRLNEDWFKDLLL